MTRDVPWYLTFFSPEYWEFSQAEYTPERTAKEVGYLLEVLAEKSPGPRVVDLGCGLGRHAIPLAEAGYEVVGLDVSQWAIDQAQKRAAEAGADVRWETIDLLSGEPLPLEVVDAAFAIQSFGWGTDAAQRRMLRNVRRHLAPQGVLVLDFSNAIWILANYLEHQSGEIDGVTYEFDRSYDIQSGRSRGRVTTGGIALNDDVRLYTPAEAIALVKESGYSFERADAEFERQRVVTRDSRYVQIVARPAATPPDALALTTHSKPDSSIKLDLRWAPDESEWLKPSPAEIWSRLDLEPSTARHYPLDDPYGSDRAAEAISTFFGADIAPDRIAFGAGVTSLLRSLIGLAERGPVAVSTPSHPDLPAWAAASGSDILELGASEATLICLDRPSIDGRMITLDELTSLAEEAVESGAVVLIDESYASYLEPSHSAVALTGAVEGLVVLRSVSKAYGWGGLRVGFAVASASVAPRIREQVPPLQVSETSYQMALQLLMAGDIVASLRDRIRKIKPRAIELFQSIGVEVDYVLDVLPWVLADEDASSLLAERGIRGKPIGFGKVRLSIPLSEDRFNKLQELAGAS